MQTGKEDLMIKYVEMTIEDAVNYCKSRGNQTVLVAVQNLEDENSIASFSKKDISECEKIIKNAETIARLSDDFVNQLRCFTCKQRDIFNVVPKGKLKTILLE